MKIKHIAVAMVLAAGLTPGMARTVISVESVERTPTSIVIRGKAEVVPTGTKFRASVVAINSKPLGNRHIIATPELATVGEDRRFEAVLQRYGSLEGFDFPKGKYTVHFYAPLHTGVQSEAVARAAGVTVVGGIIHDAEPKALPKSADLTGRPRMLDTNRTIMVGDLSQAAIASASRRGKTRSIALEIHDVSAARNPIRKILATDLLFREVPAKVGKVTGSQAVVLACEGPGPAGYIANDLYRPGGRLNTELKTDFATTLREICDEMERQCRLCR